MIQFHIVCEVLISLHFVDLCFQEFKHAEKAEFRNMLSYKAFVGWLDEKAVPIVWCLMQHNDNFLILTVNTNIL